jgi:hypothetical protein
MWRCASGRAKSYVYTNTDTDTFAIDIDIFESCRNTFQFFCSTTNSIWSAHHLSKWPVRKCNNLRRLGLWELLFRMVLLW